MYYGWITVQRVVLVGPGQKCVNRSLRLHVAIKISRNNVSSVLALMPLHIPLGHACFPTGRVLCILMSGIMGSGLCKVRVNLLQNASEIS